MSKEQAKKPHWRWLLWLEAVIWLAIACGIGVGAYMLRGALR